MNKLECGKCAKYDPILGPNEKRTKRGWCIPRSIYPATEGPGQIFPPGVKRAEAGELAKPFIVRDKQVVESCDMAKPVDFDTYEEKKKNQAVYDDDGRRILS